MAPRAHTMPDSDVEAQHIVEKEFGVRPCLWQLHVVRAILEGNDVVTVAPTGAGKTLTYWMVLLFSADSVILMVVPLKQLGAQFEKELMLKRLNAISVTASNSTDKLFQDIAAGKYRAAIFSPEIMVNNPHFEDLLRHRTFMAKVANLIFDEAHVIKEWGASFRDAYLRVGVFRNLMARSVPIHIASATLSPAATQEIKAHLRMRSNAKVFRLSIDRGNIFLQVKRMRHPANSFRDLADYIPADGSRPKKFLMFFNGRNQAQAAAEFLRGRMPKDHRHRVKWVHAGMTDEFREDEIFALKVGESDGECATEAVGLGIDLPDVYQVIQYGVPKSINTWWQRAGRAVRDLKLSGTAILLAEPSYFDDKKDEAAKRAAETEAQKKLEAEVTRQAVEDAIRQAQAAQAVGVVETGNGTGKKRKGPPAAGSRKKPRKESYKPETYKPEAEKHYDVFGREIRVDRALDDFINAENRVENCRRKIVLIHFGSVGLAPITLPCCSRCAPKVPQFCCDLCHPDYWKIEPCDMGSKESTTRMYQPKEYRRGWREEKLRKELITLRKELWKEKIGPGRMLSPQAIWPTELLTRMVDLAHYSKLKTTDDLHKQTPWFYNQSIGPKILAAITALHFPPIKGKAPAPAASPFVSTPLARMHAPSSTPLSPIPTPGARPSGHIQLSWTTPLTAIAASSDTHASTQSNPSPLSDAHLPTTSGASVPPVTPPPSYSTPLFSPSRTVNTPSRPAVKKRKQNVCGNCGAVGHNKNNRLKCPKFQAVEDVTFNEAADKS